MPETSLQNNYPWWRRVGWFWAVFFVLAALTVFAVLVAAFYAEENWRGKQAWEHCQHEFEAKGTSINWNDYIPPAVPDDQNFFKAPKMTAWFVKNQSVLSNELTAKLQSKDTTTTNLDEAFAVKYLAWSDQFAPDFDLIRSAAQRPYARMDGDYSIPYQIPIPNFVAVRIVAQTLAQRAKCQLRLGQPAKAMADLTLLHDLRHLLEAAPTGRPMTLVAAMINVAITGLYANTLADGLRAHAWQEPQLVELQKQLADINLNLYVCHALQTEPVGVCRDFELQSWSLDKFFSFGRKPNCRDKLYGWLWPQGWTYQNMVNVVNLETIPLAGFDLVHDTIAPHQFDTMSRANEAFYNHMSPYKLLAALAVPNFIKAEQTTAFNQTLVNQAQIVCALERYRLAQGHYPETLDTLVPQFIQKMPHDLIGGEPLVYRRTNDGKFLLYSIGWNETDDDGKPGTLADVKTGDWVWQ